MTDARRTITIVERATPGTDRGAFEEVCNVVCLEKFRITQNLIQFLQQLKIEQIEQLSKNETSSILEKTFKEQQWLLLNENKTRYC